MIHECLLNLWRSPLPVDPNKNWIHLYELNEFLHPGEQKLLQAIFDIAMDYHKIQAFTRSILNHTLRMHQTSQVKTGLYITAFCNGVENVLENYRKEIIKLEHLFLQNPQLSLTFILSSVEKYRCLFQMLLSMIHVIKEDSIHGCLLIGRLHKYGYCEIDQITSATELVIKTINQHFHRHLCNWIICGELVDTFGEFFIIDDKVPDENFLYPEQIIDLKETDLSNSKHLHQFKKSKVRRPPYVRKFSINWPMVPIFINEDLAESILFIGRIVWIIQNDPKKTKSDKYHIRYKRDMEGKDSDYYEILKNLEDNNFNNNEFQRIIESCRNKLTKYLWSVMLNEGNLVEHLNLIRDYFVLGRGELYQQFITVTEAHLKDTTSYSTIQNLNFIFLETARKLYGDNDKTYTKFELTSNSDNNSTNPWTRLQLNFEIKWPLHIVFHPKVMTLYNKLFCFLLHLKKTQIDLNKLWALQRSKKHVDQRILPLRENLIFLINNLQYYLQVDVIEAQFSLLLKAVQNANEFEDIIKVHHNFISNLLAKTFVATSDQSQDYGSKHQLYQIPALQCETPSKVYNLIIKLFDLCEVFCLVASTWNGKLMEPQIIELQEYQTRYDLIVESLLFLLYRLHENASGQHLLQLLLQLDFNRYFSKSKPDLNLSVLL